jgi:predicted aspartyl protease
MIPVGTFRASIEIGDPAGVRWEQVEALVDTGPVLSLSNGASYAWLPRDLLARLGVSPQFRREFLTADGRVIERDMAVTLARWDGQALPTFVVFGDEGAPPLHNV